MVEQNAKILPCADKITYETKVTAIGAAAAVNWQRGLKLKPYVCTHCSLWHLASI